MSVHSLQIAVGKEFVDAFLHSPPVKAAAAKAQSCQAGAILVSGAGGGVYGPTGIWASLATRLAQAGVPAVRLDYRRPNHTPSCVADIHAAVDALNTQFGIKSVGLVGWSFGSAPVFTLATKMLLPPNVCPLVRLGACAVVAPQTADAFGIRDCAQAQVPVLLVHGSSDRCLSPECSFRLKSAFDSADQEKCGKCEILLLEGDDHCLTHQYARAEQRILDFLLDSLLGDGHALPVADHSLVPSAEVGLDLMKKGHDLAEDRASGERESVNEPTRQVESI